MIRSKCRRFLYVQSEKECWSDMNFGETSDYEILTINRNHSQKDLNSLLMICRRIVREEKIDFLLSQSEIFQIFLGKLFEEFVRFRNFSMNFRSALKTIDRSSLIEVFGENLCVPTLKIDFQQNVSRIFPSIRDFLSKNQGKGFVKSAFPIDDRSATFRFDDQETFLQRIDFHQKIYQTEIQEKLQRILRIFLSGNEFDAMKINGFLVQPFFDLIVFPHWRLVICSGAIFNGVVSTWPIVDGYSGWPYFSEKPCAILPIIVCPSQQLTEEQERLVYCRFNEDLNILINRKLIRSGWIEMSYFVSIVGEIRLISIRPNCSYFLCEAFRLTTENGNPLETMVDISSRKEPSAPILNGKRFFIHRVWAKLEEKIRFDELVDFSVLRKTKHFVRFRFQPEDFLDENFLELGLIQICADVVERALLDLIELRQKLFKRLELVPFSHHSMLNYDENQFDPLTCRPSDRLKQRFNFILTESI